jgi:16S rRNA (adenine1518-N6/adenine1519-N6)-dimethyltransferase
MGVPLGSATLVFMDISRVEDLRTALKLAGIRPHKSLGQHFLVDRSSLETIMGAADLTPRDVVLEVGPGLGVMTHPLLERTAHVTAVETDPTLAELLRRDAPRNLTVIEEDILRFNLATLPADYKVVANIPYYLTSKLIRLLLESPNPPSMQSLLIQKEVAERITAGPGKYSMLSLSVQFYAEVELVAIVERHKFWPAPAVDSAVLKITRRPSPAFEAVPDKLFRLMKAGFGEKRKQLKNSLAGGLNLNQELVEQLLADSRLGPTARAQELSLDDWSRLYAQVNSAGALE